MHSLPRIFRLPLLFAALCTFIPAVHAAPGDIAPLDLNIGGGSHVTTAALQPDGRMIVGGSFSSVLGALRPFVARINADGSIDPAFDPRPDDYVHSVAVQMDGKVLLGGFFTMLTPNGGEELVIRRFIARMNADGSLDTGFDPRADDYVYSVLTQPDGKVLLCGSFTTLQPNGSPNPVPRAHIARVNQNGTLDTTFDPKANGIIYGMALQSDGKILLAGEFTSLQPNNSPAPVSRQHLARLNPDGTLDAGFTTGTNNTLHCVLQQPDGKIVFGGIFNTVFPPDGGSPATRSAVARVNADGTLDNEFDPRPNYWVASIALQADGKMVLGGTFTFVQPHGTGEPVPRQNIARVFPDGSLDTTFDPNPSNQVFSLTLQPDGSLLTGGWFDRLQPPGAAEPIPRRLFARVENDSASQTLTIPALGQILWQRTGSAPEVSRVVFEVSEDGGANWNPLGEGIRGAAPNTWELIGVSLPPAGILRARGIHPCGFANGSTSIIEQSLTFPPPDDADHDGYSDLMELALGLNPSVPDPGGLPPVTVENGYLTMTLTKRPGFTYEVQSASTLLPSLPGSFSPATTTILNDTPTTLKVRDNTQLTTQPRRYLRLKVTAAP
jgi:uncharacterized delta-60 repeat protein